MTEEKLRCVSCTHEEFKGIVDINDRAKMQCLGCGSRWTAEELKRLNEPIDPKEVVREAYEYGYEQNVKLMASGGLHSDHWPEARAIAGNLDVGSGCNTMTRHVKLPNGEWTVSDHLVDKSMTAMAQGRRDYLESDDSRVEEVVASLA